MHTHNPPSAKLNIIFITIMLLVIIIDQLSKLWIRTHLILGQSFPETGFFRLEYAQNTGAVFGMFQGNNVALTIMVVIEAIIILVGLVLIRVRYTFLATLLNTLCMGLILGGLFGNLIDRIHLGYVTDFITMGPWPNFNVADASGVVGVIVLAFSLVLASRTSTPSGGN